MWSESIKIFNPYEALKPINQCVMCGAEMPEGGHVCAKCAAGVTHPKPLDIPLAQVVDLPVPNTELSFGAGDGNCDFSVHYRRTKPLNKFQIWMYKVCFGIRARNI